MTRATAQLLRRWREDCVRELRRRPLVALTLGGEARCSVCGWAIEGEARGLEHGLAHVACAEGEHAGRGGA